MYIIGRWFVHFPGEFHALGPVGPFRTEREVRAWARNWAKIDRLPPRWTCWRE